MHAHAHVFLNMIVGIARWQLSLTQEPESKCNIFLGISPLPFIQNFRPIALTSCVGKLYTTLLKDRWLRFMLVNNYLNTSVQKAFILGIPAALSSTESY